MEREETSAHQAGLSPAKRALLERWKRGEAVPRSAVPALGRRADAGPAPLSSSQQRLWFLDQLAPGNPAYGLRFLVGLSGPLDRGALVRSFQEVLHRHEILRSVFPVAAGEPVQEVLPQVGFELPWVDFTGLPPERRWTEAAGRIQESADRGFDLQRAPLVRALLLGVDDGEHRLLVTMHHIVADGWSMGVLLREVATLYEAVSRGLPSPLAPLPLQYADFAVWQRRWLSTGALEQDLSYWRRQLQGAPAALDLPADRPRPARQTFRGASVQVALGPEVTAALAALAHGRGATLFMVLLAVFQTLLRRSTGQEDLLLGTPVAGRNRRELEALIGLFVNTLVLRGDLAGDPRFGDLLDRVRRTVLEAFDHQDLPFERLVEEVQPDRDLGRNPLFQVMFALQNTPLPRISLAGLTLRQEELESRTAMFDLVLSLREREGGVTGFLEYSTDLFEPATAMRLAAHFGRLAAGVAEAPETRISELPLLTREERQQLLAWNDRAVPFQLDTCLHERFAAWAAETPDAPAVVSGDELLSYGELERRANQLARHLRRLGVGPEVPAGLCVERSTEMVVGILGILKAGGAYVPLDASYPRERLALMLEDAGAPVLLTQGGMARELAAGAAAVLRLDSDWQEIARQEDGPFDSGATPDSLAYVIYTSGSTGRPKGVACLHRGAINLLADLDRRRPLAPGDACGLWTSISFDVSVWEIFSALCFGGVLCIPSESERTSAEALFPWMARHRIRSGYLPPFLLADYASWVRAGGDERRTLRRLLVGVEPIRESVLASLQAASDLRIVNGYGPTEATVCATFYDIGAGPVPERWTPLGLAAANCRVHLLDDHLQEVPVGVPGEIWVGGAGLARGYFGRPDLTAERFVPDPIGGAGAGAGARCYRTGDLARRLPDGNLTFLGRRDHQVKVRGVRIELGEIEKVLRQHPGVRETVAMVRQDPRSDKHLVAYVVPEEGRADIEGWREHLRRRLPEPMLPSAFVPLAALPLTPAAKVDRGALPEPDWSFSRPEAQFVPPRTPIETLLAGIWSELLGRGPVGAEDDFFTIGGHSLLATQVVSRVRQVFAVELPLQALFEARTLAGLAGRVEALLGGGAASAAPPLAAEPRTGPLPLSFSQQRLWFMDQLEPGSVLYNVPGAVRLVGPLAPGLLRRSLEGVVRRHEILRTTFRSVHGQPSQVIAAESLPSLPLVDLGGLPPREREEEAAHRIAFEARLPFDLAQGPLLRTTLLRLGAEEHVVLVTFHHIVADGWSVGIFFREIAALFRAGSTGEPPLLPELPLQFADFALWQRRWLAGEALERELDYWRRQLAGMPRILELPTDRPRPAVQSFRGRSRPMTLPPEIVAPLAGLGRRQGATLFMTLLGAFATVLGRFSGQEDLAIGSPIAGRDRREIEELIGFFVNTLVLRVDLTGDPSFEELLDRVRDVALGAYAHQSLPFERLVEELAPQRDPSHSPLFQAAFVLQNAPAEPLQLPDLTLVPVPVDSGTAKVDLLLALTERNGGLAGTWELSTDLFDATTIDRLSGHLATLLAGIAADAGSRLSELPLLTPAQRHQVRAEWNDTRVPSPGELRLDQLFTAAAERWPERTALTFEGGRLSYRELAARAGQLANHLRGLGVGPEVLVGICAEEGIERIVGVVGVILAGGAYLPLDPAHPLERLEWMAEDAGIRVLLTQEHLLSAVPRQSDAVVCLDRPLPAREPDRPAAASAATPDNLAYVIYTSGSTGRPNGVAVCHRSAVHLIDVASRHTGADEHCRVLQIVSFNFDASVLETWMALATGGTLCIVGRETRMSGPALAESIRSEGVTIMMMPPAILATIPCQDLPSLRTVLVGGDRCTADLANRWAALGDSFRLFNCYGPTETTIYATSHRCAGTYRREPGIGRPIGNIRMMVVDPGGRLVPIGVPGELWVAGAGTARGYLNRPALTAARFIPDPFGEEPGGRAYRSGDLVRLLADGEIEFLGRIDRQVKLRGLRIELGEIEATLAEHPAVRECAVLVREETPGETLLVAYLVPRQEPAPEARELRELLAAKLPSYMVPAVFVPLAAMPLLPAGKIDRAALPAPPKTGSDREVVAPRTPVEATLAGIWAQVLGVAKVGVHDNFFELGGDSILGIQVISQAQQAGLGLIAKDLFLYQTVAELAAVARAAPETSAGEQEGGEIPLTPVQRSFFDLDLEDPHHFNQALLLDLREAVDPARLERALGRVVDHHAALRFRYRQDEAGGWHQICAAAEDTAVAGVDLSALPPERRRAALEAAAAQLQGSLDLTRGPLLRATLFALGDGGQRLFLVLHHLIVDGVSWRILLADLEASWRAVAKGGEASLPPVPTTFRQWSGRLAEHARSAEAAAELDYWLDASRTLVRPLPLDRPGGTNTVVSARSLVTELEAGETRSLLQEVAAAYHSRINDALLTALLQAFAGWGGEPRLLIDLEGHGREDLFAGVDTSRTVGWLTAVFPVLLELDRKAHNPGEHLKSIKEQLRAIPRGGIGYGILRFLGEEAHAERLRAMPAPEVVFNYLGQLDRGLPEASLFAPAPESGGEARSRRQRRGHLLEINGGISEGRLRLTWTYSESLHDRGTVQALADRFLASLRSLIEHCRREEAGGFTPSDFPEARVSQKDLDALMARIDKRRPKDEKSRR